MTNQDPDDWTFHPDREDLVAEAHARPAQNVTPPCRILNVAFKASPEVQDKFFSVLGAPGGITGPRHVVQMHEGVRVKLERHTEIMTCTLFHDVTSSRQSVDLAEFFKVRFPVSGTEILVLLELNIVKSAAQMLKSLPPNQRIAGGRIHNEIDVRSSFKPDDDGIIRFVLHSEKSTGEELGRRLQRLIEMETYRTMCLLGLPKARAVSSRLTEYERELDALTVSLRASVKATRTGDEELFQQLSALSERNNILASEIRYRFAASRAYFELFRQRTLSLEEQKVGDLQTLSGFLRSRLDPAMATIESTAKRQETLTNDLSRALVLLRTRIELSLNKGNQALLTSMDKRHDEQLKISRTVEGLSIVAITYYAVGLVSYMLKAVAKQAWMPVSETFLTAISVPLILALVWYFMRRIRNAWAENAG